MLDNTKGPKGDKGSTGAAGDLITVSAIPLLAVDWSLGNFFTKVISTPIILTFGNLSEKIIRVKITSSGTGAVVFPSNVKWAGGVPPIQTAVGTDLYRFIYDGVDIVGIIEAQDLKFSVS